MLIDPSEGKVIEALNSKLLEQVDKGTLVQNHSKIEDEKEAEDENPETEDTDGPLRIDRVKIATSSLLQIRTQLHALDLIRFVHSNFAINWELTERGRATVFELTAIKKEL